MLVAFNSVMQILLYAPLSLFYLNVVSGSTTAVDVGFWPVAKSVLLFLGVPLVAGVLLRAVILAFKPRRWFEDVFMRYFGPLALVGLLYTIVVMFAAQGSKIVSEIGNVARVAVPMFIYFLIMFAGTLAVCWYSRASYSYAATQAFTAARCESSSAVFGFFDFFAPRNSTVPFTQHTHTQKNSATISSSRSPSPSGRLALTAPRRSPPRSGRSSRCPCF